MDSNLFFNAVTVQTGKRLKDPRRGYSLREAIPGGSARKGYLALPLIKLCSVALPSPLHAVKEKDAQYIFELYYSNNFKA